MDCSDFELGDDEPSSLGMHLLRGRQTEWIYKIEADLLTHSRLLVVAPGGVGKTTVMGVLAKRAWELYGLRTLVLENRDRLTEQTATRIRDETGLVVDVEKGDQHASPHAVVVVACVQSLSKVSRLTGFSDNHFGVLLVDECHLALSASWLRCIRYAHYGAESLADGWTVPVDGTYTPKAKVIGFTASPNLGERRSLGELFHRVSVNYSYLSAIEEGWLVGLKEINVPLQINTRGFRVKRSAEGNSFSVSDQNAAFTPEVIQKLCAHYVEYASDRKGMIFVPSVEIARQMAGVLAASGLNSCYVSGECIDKNEKTDAFQEAGNGSVMVSCTIYTYGVDFPNVNCIAPFGPIISKVRYVQSIYRGSRVLPGVLKAGMTQDERLAAIAASDKQYTLVLSPYFISDRIDICEPFDMFFERDETSKKAKRAPRDMTDPAKIRDYIKALEKAADPHRNKQARTIDPVKFSLSIGDDKMAALAAQEGSPVTRPELDALLALGYDTTLIKTSEHAQRAIGTARERDRLKLASVKTATQLHLHLGWPAALLATMKQSQAGVLLARRVRYKAPEEVAADDPALAYGEG